MKCKVCKPVYFKHDMGWDVYPQSECYRFNGEWIPAWFDGFIFEDMPSKAEAMRELAKFHLLGICLVS
jgi:hypothetical protein